MNEPARRVRSPSSGAVLTGATAILVYLALAKLLLHLVTAGNYGYFRDELYYIAAGERLDLGYVDFPPFVALVARITSATLGDSLVALHLFPALAGAIVVFLAGLMARELGGGRFAQGLAALATLVVPNFLVFGTWLSMDAFDQLFWVAGAYVLLVILKRDRPRLWLLFGLIAGLGLLTKLTILYFGLAVLFALIVTPARRQLLTVWPWLGGALALLFLVPYIVWQFQHGWPTLGFWANYGAKVDPSSPIEFLEEQIVTMQPPTLPLWIAGLYYYLFSGDGRPVRALGWIYVILFAMFVIQNSRFYFLAPAYPMLFAAGATLLVRFAWRSTWSWIKPAYAIVLAVSGIVVAPITVVPVLPVETLAKVTGAAGGDAGVQIETREVSQLPQNFADRFGWKKMTATVADVYDTLPADQRANACILTGNYGEAGAIDFFGPAHGLPDAISGRNSYYIWGSGDCTGDVVISIGVPRELLVQEFASIEQRATVRCEYCMPDENGLPVYLNQEPKMPLKEAWPMFKHYD